MKFNQEKPIFLSNCTAFVFYTAVNVCAVCPHGRGRQNNKPGAGDLCTIDVCADPDDTAQVICVENVQYIVSSLEVSPLVSASDFSSVSVSFRV